MQTCKSIPSNLPTHTQDGIDHRNRAIQIEIKRQIDIGHRRGRIGRFGTIFTPRQLPKGRCAGIPRSIGTGDAHSSDGVLPPRRVDGINVAISGQGEDGVPGTL